MYDRYAQKLSLLGNISVEHPILNLIEICVTHSKCLMLTYICTKAEDAVVNGTLTCQEADMSSRSGCEICHKRNCDVVKFRGFFSVIYQGARCYITPVVAIASLNETRRGSRP
jgi:hypothetical protein